MIQTGHPGTAHDRAAPSGRREHVLLVRARTWTCALPIRDVIETMRALPVRKVAGAPPFVRGLSMIRGALLPVVSLGALLGAEGEGHEHERDRRFVTVKLDDRRAALEVDAVLGARQIDADVLEATPPLLSEAMPEPIEKLGVLDGQTLAMLRTARLIPEALWAELAQRGAR
jgi:purine-binding chemotaxis protein CheW